MVLNAIAPGQSEELFSLISSHSDNSSATSCNESSLLDILIKLYDESTDNNFRCRILSIICRTAPKLELQSLIPGLTIYRIDQARLHASRYGPGSDLSKQAKLHRDRMDPVKLEHALSFLFDPAFHEILSYGTRMLQFDSGDKVEIPDVVRVACHSTIINLYMSYCKETEFIPLSQSVLYKILNVCGASKRKSLHGVDNIASDGQSSFERLHKIIGSLLVQNVVSDEQAKMLETNLKASMIYLKTDYKLQIQKTSE